MKTRSVLLLVALAIFVSSDHGRSQTAVFTYQGRLTESGSPANGTYDLQFNLYTVSSGGSPLTIAVDVPDLAITNGLFTVTLNFGSTIFDGNDRWLGIGVRPGASFGAYTNVLPRQQITSAPYAIRAANFSGTLASEQLTDVYASVVNFTNAGNTFVGTFTGDGVLPWQVVTNAMQVGQANMGYVANYSNQVTITLPTSPAVGDIVRVSGAGAGGWKIAQTNGQSIRTINVEQPGAHWVARETNRNWSAVASSSDGAKLAAVVFGGRIYTSTDYGVSWTPRDSARGWVGIASSADGTKLVAVVDGGNPYTSTDSGVSWTLRDSSRAWQSVASSADGTKLVAVVLGGFIYTSTNSGTSWSLRDLARNWFAVASSANGSNLIAAVYGGQLYTSTDAGLFWTPRDIDRFWSAVASSSVGSVLLALDYSPPGKIYTSTDFGITWSPRQSDRLWRTAALSSDGSKAVVAVDGGQIYTSTDDGVSWTARESNRGWQGVASSADGSRMVAVASNGQIYTTVAATTVGTAGYLTGDVNAAVELQYVGGGLFRVLSHEGTITSY